MSKVMRDDFLFLEASSIFLSKIFFLIRTLLTNLILLFTNANELTTSTTIELDFELNSSILNDELNFEIIQVKK